MNRQTRSLMAGATLALIVTPAALGIDSARVSAETGPVDYEVASLDVEGNPTSSHYWGGARAMTYNSLSSDGSKVVFSKGGISSDPDYVPMAEGEWCGPDSYCTDIYIRDVAAGKTTSVVSRLTVQNVHPSSVWSGDWSVSAAADSFLFTWFCNRGFPGDAEGPEVIAGTAICTEPGANDEFALVLMDLGTGQTQVVDVGGEQFRSELSADGSSATYVAGDDGGSLPPTCIRPGWTCESGLGMYLWDRSGGSTWITSEVGGFTDRDGQWQVGHTRISGDGSKVFLEVDAFTVENGDWSYLLAYDTATGDFSEIRRSRDRWSIVGSSLDGETLIATSSVNGDESSTLARIDVDTGQTELVESPGCEAWPGSVSTDARYVGCGRNNVIVDGERLPPAIVDTLTGETIEIATASEGFVMDTPTLHDAGPFISANAETAAVLSHRSPEDDESTEAFEGYPLQVRVVTLGEVAPGANPPGGSDPFWDDDGSVFEDDIEWLAAAGITRGCNPPTNDRFCPDDPVTRGQMAAFLVRALDLANDGGGDLFVDDDDSVFEGDIDRLGTAGITRGCNPPINDHFCPRDLVTRGQMAAFLHRALPQR